MHSRELLHAAPKVTINTGAAGSAIAPSQVFGEYLNTHGVWLLSYAEWCKVVGTIWILLLIMEKIGLFNLVIRLIAKLKARKKLSISKQSNL